MAACDGNASPEGNLMKQVTRFLTDETGATAIEYALIAAAMALVLLAAMPLLVQAITGKFSSLSGHITSGT
jgi:pilus assembly protein Flp/PilA